MAEKKPVYNGYEERYLSGAELKKLFDNHYYATGRHHSVILGLTIPDYLDLLKIEESKEYRIFINEYFCRVMDGTRNKRVYLYSVYWQDSPYVFDHIWKHKPFAKKRDAQHFAKKQKNKKYKPYPYIIRTTTIRDYFKKDIEL